MAIETVPEGVPTFEEHPFFEWDEQCSESFGDFVGAATLACMGTETISKRAIEKATDNGEVNFDGLTSNSLASFLQSSRGPTTTSRDPRSP